MKIVLPAGLLFVLAACGAQPQSCAFVQEAVLPVTFERNVPLVDVTLNGQSVRLIFDTGANLTMVTGAALERLNLAVDPSTHSTISAVGGFSQHSNAVVDRLVVGPVVRRDLSIAVVDMPPLLGGKADGLLGNDVIGRFDVDLDLPNHRVALYRQRNCPPGRPDWPVEAVAMPRPPQGKAMPAMMITLELDGVLHTAMLDTGASNSLMDRSRALASGATPDMLAADRQSQTQGVTKNTTATGLHRFGVMNVAGEAIPRPAILVTARPGSVGNEYYGMLLGEDYLRRHRVWISYADLQAYVARPNP